MKCLACGKGVMRPVEVEFYQSEGIATLDSLEFATTYRPPKLYIKVGPRQHRQIELQCCDKCGHAGFKLTPLVLEEKE